MTPSDQPEDHKDERKPYALSRSGRDEMNLAEFPFASLRRHGDSRKAIVYQGWVNDQHGNRQQLKWIAQGGSLVGLPTEFDERLYVALMAITASQGFEARKVPFSVYQILRIMGVPKSKRSYVDAEDSLKRLVGVTIYAEGAFWDNAAKELVKTVSGFHIMEKFWLRYREKDKRIREQEGVPAYIIWSEEIWKSFKDNYIKSLDLGFFYGLESPTSRRLFRLLDKRMRHKRAYEFDIFDLAGKLGMVHYQFPAKVIEKLQPAFDELIARGFLKSAEVIKVNGYTRVRFVQAAKHTPSKPKEEIQPEEQQSDEPEENAEPVAGTVHLSQSAREDEELAAADQKDIEKAKDDQPYSEAIARFAEDLSKHHLHDYRHINSNISNAMNRWRESKLPEEEFIALMEEAKERTLEHTEGIRKTVDGHRRGLKNRAPYFFEVLKDLMRQTILDEFRRGFKSPTEV